MGAPVDAFAAVSNALVPPAESLLSASASVGKVFPGSASAWNVGDPGGRGGACIKRVRRPRDYDGVDGGQHGYIGCLIRRR